MVPLPLRAADLDALIAGFSLLGAGGGGSAYHTALILRHAQHWPLLVHSVDELDPQTPCLAVSYIGSTLLIEERLPDDDPFGPGIAAVERWLGTQGAAVCSAEGAGLNGLAPLQLAPTRTVIDADCMGRALPDLDQISLLVDRLPGLVAAVPTGGGGVALVQDARPEDVETILRSATRCHGGWAGFVLGGFTVGDLAEHAMLGGLQRAHQLGQALLEAAADPPHGLGEALGGRTLGVGRVFALHPEPSAPGVVSFEVRTDGGDVIRLLGRSEFVAVVRNGVVVASTPTVIAALDAVTHRALEIDQVAVGKDLILIALAAPSWWSDDPRRLSLVVPERWGLESLEVAG